MSYTLKLTNGKILLTLADQQSDKVSTSVTLIGKNVNAYGTDLNDNFIRMLENFANTVPPTSPLVGQIWFNTVEQRMYVYNSSNEFKPVGSPILSAIEPVGLVPGDMWIDTTNKRLKFKDDAGNLITAGHEFDDPAVPVGTKSGWVVESISDTSYVFHAVLGLYANGNLLGILSDTAFNFLNPFPIANGMTSVGIGFNANSSLASVGNVKFIGTATSADSVGSILSSDIVTKTINQVQNILGTVNILNNKGLSIGESQDIQFSVTGTNNVATLDINGNANQDFQLRLLSPNSATALYIDSTNERVGIFNTTPQYAVDIKGDVQINGNLQIVGTSTYITTTDLRIDDKVIELNYTTGTNTDFLADQGGIKLLGAVDHTILWNRVSASWVSSENIDLLNASKSFKIGGVDVLTASSLGLAITSAPGLTSFGNITTATIGQVIITTATIGLTVSKSLIIGTGGVTDVNFNGKKLFNLGAPSVADDPQTAATIGYVDDAVSIARAGQFATQIDVTGIATGTEDPALNNFAVDTLNYMLPPTDTSPYGIPEGGRARVLVTRYSSFGINGVVSNPILGISVTVDKGGVQNSATVRQYDAAMVATTDIPAVNLGVNRAIKQYIVTGGTWVPLNYPTPGSPSNTVYTDGTW